MDRQSKIIFGSIPTAFLMYILAVVVGVRYIWIIAASIGLVSALFILPVLVVLGNNRTLSSVKGCAPCGILSSLKAGAACCLAYLTVSLLIASLCSLAGNQWLDMSFWPRFILGALSFIPCWRLTLWCMKE